MRIARFLAVVLATGVLVTSGIAAGAGPPAVDLTVAIDPTSGAPGTEIEVTGTCEDPPGSGMACAGTIVIDIALVDATGAVVAMTSTETGGGADTAYDTIIVVPGTATAGTYTVRAEAVDTATAEVLASTEESFTVPEPASSVPSVDVVPAPEAAAPEPAPPAPVPARPRVTG